MSLPNLDDEVGELPLFDVPHDYMAAVTREFCDFAMDLGADGLRGADGENSYLPAWVAVLGNVVVRHNGWDRRTTKFVALLGWLTESPDDVSAFWTLHVSLRPVTLRDEDLYVLSLMEWLDVRYTAQYGVDPT